MRRRWWLGLGIAGLVSTLIGGLGWTVAEQTYKTELEQARLEISAAVLLGTGTVDAVGVSMARAGGGPLPTWHL